MKERERERERRETDRKREDELKEELQATELRKLRTEAE
jgi:hypothetical protein